MLSLETEIIEVKKKSETGKEPRQSNILNREEIEKGMNVEKEKPTVNMFK